MNKNTTIELTQEERHLLIHLLINLETYWSAKSKNVTDFRCYETKFITNLSDKLNPYEDGNPACFGYDGYASEEAEKFIPKEYDELYNKWYDESYPLLKVKSKKKK